MTIQMFSQGNIIQVRNLFTRAVVAFVQDAQFGGIKIQVS